MKFSFAQVSGDMSVQEPVQESSLSLLGRGYVNSETQESLALACISIENGNCRLARFVYIHDQKADYLGLNIVLPYHQTNDGEVELDKKSLENKFSVVFPQSTKKKSEC